MHDPLTVAFHIRYPWYKYRPWPKRLRALASNGEFGPGVTWNHRMTRAERRNRSPHWPDGYRDTFATIWHVDPECDGSDDSCGWSRPHLTPRHRVAVRAIAWQEAHYPYFLRCNSKTWAGTRHEAECLYRGLLLTVAAAVGVPMTFDQAAKEASGVIHHSDCCDTANVFCFVPGYHTNNLTDTAHGREDVFYGIAANTARWLLADRRPWWRHPRWHVHHWRIWIHPLQMFKRWAFSRCAKCGGRFGWGESPTSHQWHGTGPLWFRSERGAMHSRCVDEAKRPSKVLEGEAPND